MPFQLPTPNLQAPHLVAMLVEDFALRLDYSVESSHTSAQERKLVDGSIKSKPVLDLIVQD